jgi:penicillin V acylase-like amidase (Ntn superfamily)
MCSRIKYETGTGTFIIGRGMDWNDPTAETDLWVFPKGLQRDGGIGKNPIRWTSKYGSVVASFYNAATADGMNEKGLVGNILYLAEADYGDPAKTGKPTISVGAWLQYILDSYATVAEAVAALKDEPFTIVAPVLPNGRAAAVHTSLSDPSGDSAILEYLDGELVIHHGPECQVMTNSPVYEQQIALNAYWDLIGGNNMLPGTINAADRFVRLSYFLKSSPKYKDRKMAVAAVFSQMRAIGVPLGMEDPNHPNISATLWRTVADHDALRYYFKSTISPAVFWVDLDKVNLEPGAGVMKLETLGPKTLAGEVSAEFQPAQPFEFMTA